MESVIKQLESLTLKEESYQTGVFFHKECSLHNPEKKSEEDHCENKQRVEFALNHLAKQKTLGDCKVFDQFQEIEEKWIAKVHGEKYLESLNELHSNAK